MSWWGTWDKGISKMASTALKQAQKKIDKVLDIQEGEEGYQAAVAAAQDSSRSSSPVLPPQETSQDDFFFREWLPEGQSVAPKRASSKLDLKKKEKASSPSSIGESKASPDLALDMSASQVTNVGDWAMEESLMLASQIAEAPEMPEEPSEGKPELRTSSCVSLKSISESERGAEDDDSATCGLSSSMHDRGSHLSMSSDCTDMTLRGDERGLSPSSEQLITSKTSNESMYSGVTSRSAHSEPLVESCEFEAEVFNQEKAAEADLNLTKQEDEEEHEEEDEGADLGCLEVELPEQPEAVFEAASSAPDHSPSGLDEVETGTSSDIEVISSCCTSNNGAEHGLPSESHHPMRLASHTRSVSDCSFLSNIVESVTSDEGVPYEVLQKRLSEAKEVLEARETKLLQMSKENIDLRETNSILRQQLHQSEASRESEMTDLNVLTVEFTNRIGEAEKRLQSAAREKEQLKKKLQRAEAEIANKNEDQRFERALQEKELQIQELLAEGEKMAQEQLKTNNIVKKLRAKEREVEGSLQAQNAKAEKLEKENEHLRNVIDNRDENEKQHVDAINQLTRAVQKQEKEILTYKRHLEEAQEKSRSLQINLESAYKELAELHKSNAAAASEAAHLTMSAEMAAKEHAKAAVAQIEATWTDERRALQGELDELRYSLTSQEREAARREEELRKEIEYLQRKHAEAEQRNEELASGLGNATRPVLRQLESLQASYNSHSHNWELAERQLNERLAEAQRSLAAASEQERAWRERVTELETQGAGVSAQVVSLRQEKGRLTAQLQAEKSRAEVLDEEKHKLMVQLQNSRLDWQAARDELKKEALLSENALESTRNQLAAERRRSQHLTDQLAAAERRLALASEDKARRSSAGSTESAEIAPRHIRQPSSSSSLYALLRDHNASGGAAVMEHMQATLQQKDGDIAQLQRELEQREKTREALVVDMLTSNQRLEELTETVSRLERELSDHEALEKRYQALLQMFGEKMEENEELRLDLQDIKEMYKAQIDLLTRSQS